MNIKIATLGTCLLFIFALSSFGQSWTAPTLTPPNGNSAAPINVSSLTQAKMGGLIVSSFRAGLDSFFDGNVGIGTTSPSARLHVVGGIRIEDGTQGSGKILTSDASGNATWQTVATSSGGNPSTPPSAVHILSPDSRDGLDGTGAYQCKYIDTTDLCGDEDGCMIVRTARSTATDSTNYPNTDTTQITKDGIYPSTLIFYLLGDLNGAGYLKNAGSPSALRTELLSHDQTYTYNYNFCESDVTGTLSPTPFGFWFMTNAGWYQTITIRD